MYTPVKIPKHKYILHIHPHKNLHIVTSSYKSPWLTIIFMS